MKKLARSTIIAVSITLFAAIVPAKADLFSQLQNVLTVTSSNSLTASSLSGLTQDQMIGGLKDALAKGVENAVNGLGHSGGFLTNAAVKIPMPGKLKTVESGLRLAGQNKMADDFVGSMNHAAEQAVPVAAAVFGDAIKQMTVTDVQNILTGPNDAATQFFRRTEGTNLYTRFYPLVQKATGQVGVTAQYKQMIAKFNTVGQLGSLFGSHSKINFQAADIDDYITQKALDGLFYMVAAEEMNIRTNSFARTTDLLQKVFGSAGH